VLSDSGCIDAGGRMPRSCRSISRRHRLRFFAGSAKRIRNINNAQGMGSSISIRRSNIFRRRVRNSSLIRMPTRSLRRCKNIFGAAETSKITAKLTPGGRRRRCRPDRGWPGQPCQPAGAPRLQTYANLYGQAQQQAQSAGYGTAAWAVRRRMQHFRARRRNLPPAAYSSNCSRRR